MGHGSGVQLKLSEADLELRKGNNRVDPRTGVVNATWTMTNLKLASAMDGSTSLTPGVLSDVAVDETELEDLLANAQAQADRKGLSRRKKLYLVAENPVMDNTIASPGYSRSKPPRQVDVSGQITIGVLHPDSPQRYLDDGVYYFTEATLTTTKDSFDAAWNYLDGHDDDEDEDGGFNEFLPAGSARRSPKKHNQKDYTHYVYSPEHNQILSGWSYAEDARDGLRDLPPALRAKARVYTLAGLKRLDVNPNDDVRWAGTASRDVPHPWSAPMPAGGASKAPAPIRVSGASAGAYVMVLPSVADTLGLEEYNDLYERNIDYFAEIGWNARRDAEKAGETDEDKLDEISMEAQQEAEMPFYEAWQAAVLHVANHLFLQHGLVLEGDDPYRLVPEKSWNDVLSHVRETINGVGYFHFSSNRELMNSMPTKSPKAAVLAHLGWIKDWPAVYGEGSTQGMYERQLERELR
jgi:hypothetical protein